jgi:hypothetical protein
MVLFEMDLYYTLILTVNTTKFQLTNLGHCVRTLNSISVNNCFD